MNPDIFVFGGIRLVPYETMMIVSLAIGIPIAVNTLVKQEGFTFREAIGVSFFIPAGGLIGARLLYIILHPEFMAPEYIFTLRIAGMTFYGSLIGVAVANYIWCRWRRKSFLAVADVGIPIYLMGYSLVRIGCFFNGCCYGKVSDVPWAVVMVTAGDAPRHPVQLYASALAMIGFFLMLWLRRVRPFVGFVTFSMFLYYGLLRFTTEFFREFDAPTYWLGLTMAQVYSILLVIFAVCMIIIFYRREKTTKGRGFSG